jgi:hypothetical protein
MYRSSLKLIHSPHHSPNSSIATLSRIITNNYYRACPNFPGGNFGHRAAKKRSVRIIHRILASLNIHYNRTTHLYRRFLVLRRTIHLCHDYSPHHSPMSSEANAYRIIHLFRFLLHVAPFTEFAHATRFPRWKLVRILDAFRH